MPRKGAIFVSSQGLTFVTGGSGFIGSEIIKNSDSPVRALVHRKDVQGSNVQLVYGSILADGPSFQKWLKGVMRVVHVARPSSGGTLGRYLIARKTRKAITTLISKIESSDVSSSTVVHGSLSYGDRGEEIIGTESRIRPEGYARAYSIGEIPWIENLGSGGEVQVVRAPWVIGNGSWFEMLYKGDIVPVIEGGNHWMSLVSVESLSEFVWSLEGKGPGVFHPPLICRCRQSDFARMVARVRGVEATGVSRSQLVRKIGRIATESVLCSIRIDDGREMRSESGSSLEELENYVLSIIG